MYISSVRGRKSGGARATGETGETSSLAPLNILMKVLHHLKNLIRALLSSDKNCKVDLIIKSSHFELSSMMGLFLLCTFENSELFDSSVVKM